MSLKTKLASVAAAAVLSTTVVAAPANAQSAEPVVQGSFDAYQSVFSDLQFQRDMGILLMFMFSANMLGAVILCPALCRFVLPLKNG